MEDTHLRLLLVTHFRELAIYRLAVDLRRGIFERSKTWPATERYSLTGQARRSSRSIGANLAEAWAKRRFSRHFVSKLSDALGETEETMVWVDVAHECGYLTTEDHDEMIVLGRRIGSGLVRMMRNPQQWCGPARLASGGVDASHFKAEMTRLPSNPSTPPEPPIPPA